MGMQFVKASAVHNQGETEVSLVAKPRPQFGDWVLNISGAVNRPGATVLLKAHDPKGVVLAEKTIEVTSNGNVHFPALGQNEEEIQKEIAAEFDPKIWGEARITRTVISDTLTTTVSMK